MLVSICIPAYNCAATLARTLDSIVRQIAALGLDARDRVELVLCDDASKDDTLAIAREYAAQHPFFRIFHNAKNLGMDGNFRQTALHARGRFVWYSGQDDIFGPGAIAKVLSVLESNENLGFVYVNYSQMNHDMSRAIVPSFLLEEALDKPRLAGEPDFLFRSPAEYFALFPKAPTFLPATVIRRDFWLETDVSAYDGTAFNQTAVILLNFRRAAIYVVTKPYIQGRVPDDQWQAHGQSYFRIMLGWMVMETLVNRDPRDAAPKHLYTEKKRTFLKNLFPLIRRARHMGMRPTADFLDKLALIYGKGAIYWLFILPAMRLPLACLDAVSACYQVVKKIRAISVTFQNS